MRLPHVDTHELVAGAGDFWLAVPGVLVALGDLLTFYDRRADFGTYYYRTPNVREA